MADQRLYLQYTFGQETCYYLWATSIHTAIVMSGWRGTTSRNFRSVKQPKSPRSRIGPTTKGTDPDSGQPESGSAYTRKKLVGTWCKHRVWLWRAMYAIYSLTGEPLYDAYTTYLPRNSYQRVQTKTEQMSELGSARLRSVKHILKQSVSQSVSR